MVGWHRMSLTASTPIATPRAQIHRHCDPSAELAAAECPLGRRALPIASPSIASLSIAGFAAMGLSIAVAAVKGAGIRRGIGHLAHDAS